MRRSRWPSSSACSKPSRRAAPSPAACPSPAGWPKPTSSGRNGAPKATRCAQAKADATLLWIKAQEDAGLDIVTDGEQSRQHFVHGFLEQVEGIDFEHKVKMGIRNNRYNAMVPQVVAPLRSRAACMPSRRGCARPHHAQAQVHLPGPMTIVDTVADRSTATGRRWRWPLPSC
jgi:5-methyltetrahydropteroyltriglutamate--homocysteine methyltransferase